MLLDRYRQLLTAYVDGELSSRQRRQVARLLSRSQEARQLLEQLQADSRSLRRLPRPTLPADFSVPVLRTIAERRLTPGLRRIAGSVSTPLWMKPLASWAAAAAVLFLLGTASYLYFAASLPQATKTEIVHKVPASPGTKQQDKPAPPVVKNEPALTTSPQESTPEIERVSPSKQRIVDERSGKKPTPNVPETTPSQPKEETALTNRLEMFQLDLVPDTLPVVLKVIDLDQESARKQLRDELQKDRDFRIELPCQNGTKAFDRVQKAAQTLHFALILDKQAQERIKLKWRTNYVLYVEDVTPDEVIRFVKQIGAEDRKSAGGKPTELRIDRLVLTRMTAQQRKELSTLLGVDPTIPPARTTGTLGADPSKPLADLTAQQLGQALAEQGGKSQAAGGTPAAKAPEHFALVLPYNPVRPSPTSDEIKRFLDTRKPARSGTIRVLLVLRS
jgi:hypothetical protein